MFHYDFWMVVFPFHMPQNNRNILKELETGIRGDTEQTNVCFRVFSVLNISYSACNKLCSPV